MVLVMVTLLHRVVHLHTHTLQNTTPHIIRHTTQFKQVRNLVHKQLKHYDDVKMDAMASQITSLTIVYSTVYSGADQSKHQSSASLAFAWGIHRGPVNSPQKWPVTRKMFPFDDVIMTIPYQAWTPYTVKENVFQKRISCLDALWHHIAGSTLVEVMICL